MTLLTFSLRYIEWMFLMCSAVVLLLCLYAELVNKHAPCRPCLLDAPGKDAIINHHEKHGFKCEWITEVKTTRSS